MLSLQKAFGLSGALVTRHGIVHAVLWEVIWAQPIFTKAKMGLMTDCVC